MSPKPPAAPRANSQRAKRPTDPGRIPAGQAKGKPRLATASPVTRSKAGAKLCTAAEISQIFEIFRNLSPEPKGELEHVNPYTLLVAVVLSAQATDAGVNKATRALFQNVRTPQAMLQLGEDKLREAIKTIGLYRTKARNVIALSERLIDQHGGEVPHDRDALENLPGVGRKTANVVLNMAFGEATMAVDTHVFRVANRIGLSQGQNPLSVETDLIRVIPAEFALHAHHWLILHGRYLCKARRPECWRCPIDRQCKFPAKTSAPA